MKTIFDLEVSSPFYDVRNGYVSIVDEGSKDRPYVCASVVGLFEGYRVEVLRARIRDKDLERFAVNILKALQSDKLK